MMDKEVLEVVLKKSFNDSKIKRIIEMKSEPALPEGENFLSKVLKLHLKVVLGNGRIAKKSFIAKKAFGADPDHENYQHRLIFDMEEMIYTKVLREMDYLMEEFGDTEGSLWCEFIYYSPSDGIIVLEDLKASGFATLKRPEVQELDHAKLALRALGRFHAMAKVLEDRGHFSKDNFKPWFFLYEEACIRNVFFGGIKTLVRGIREGWGEEWAGYADKLSQVPFEEYWIRLQKSGNFNEKTFKCLNHGDCWSSNIMFKNNWEGKPFDVRFVDYQICHYNSPCLDVIMYIYRCVKPSIRHQHLKSLIKLYYESLTSTLDRFGYKGSKPSLEEINDIMDQLQLFGLIFFLTFFPLGLTTRADFVNYELLFKTNGEEGFKTDLYYGDSVIENLGEDLKLIVKLLES